MVPSRNKAQALIQLGKVLVNEQVIEKAGTQVKPDVTIRIRGEKHRFVSRGGEKLDGALSHFDIDCTGLIAADIGASTGGFTDCLLQRNVEKVCHRCRVWSTGLENTTTSKGRRDGTLQRKTLRVFTRPHRLGVGDVSFISITKKYYHYETNRCSKRIGHSAYQTSIESVELEQ